MGYMLYFIPSSTIYHGDCFSSIPNESILLPSCSQLGKLHSPSSLTLTLSLSLSRCIFTGGPKVYNVTDYLDDHPGGAEVLLDVGGQDADEFFEDIGHSKDARDELKKILVGTLKLDEAELSRRAEAARIAAEKGAGGMNMMVVFFAIIAIVAAYYKTQM